mgnify:CR=1 FL=1
MNRSCTSPNIFFHVLSMFLYLQALEQHKKLAVIIIDDAEFMDPISWKFIHNCISGRRDVMVVMCE